MIAIGEASRQSGVGIETIRFYEREGIVPKPERAANNRRLYSAPDVGRLRFLKRCRELGFPLSDAKTLLDLAEGGDADCQSVKEIAELHIINVRDKVRELRRLESALSELTANCDSGNVSCPMLIQLRTAQGQQGLTAELEGDAENPCPSIGRPRGRPIADIGRPSWRRGAARQTGHSLQPQIPACFERNDLRAKLPYNIVKWP
jgi:MerR family mercuric resistance operon transcriptional regulator